MAIVELPGSVIEAAVRLTRQAEKPAPHFLHFDEEAKMNDSCGFETVDSKPFEAEKLYKVLFST